METKSTFDINAIAAKISGGLKKAQKEIEEMALQFSLGMADTADKFEEQDDDAFRAWLAREDLNKFSPNEKKVEISSIFKWFKQDFDKAGGIPKILGRFAPAKLREFAASGNYEIKYLPYNWGLNDQGPHGRADLSESNLL